jgi:hypothetical protein
MLKELDGDILAIINGKKYKNMAKKIITTEELMKKGRIQVVSRKTTKQEPLLQWLTKDITGISREKQEGLLRPLIQKTVGSKGIAGVFQLPGRVIETIISIGEIEKTAKSQKDLADSTLKLIQLAKTKPGGSTERQRLMDLARDQMKQGMEMIKPMKELEKRITKPSEAVATTLRAGTTVGSMILGAPTSYLQAAKFGAVTGAPLQAAEAIEAGRKPIEVMQQTAIGAGVGAVTGLMFYGIQQGAKKIAKSIYKQIAQWGRARRPEEMADILVDRKMALTAGRMKNSLQKDIKPLSDKIDDIIAGYPDRKYTQNRILTAIAEEGRKAKGELGRYFGVENFKAKVNRLLGNFDVKIGLKRLNLTEINNLKKDIYRAIGDKAYKKFFADNPLAKQRLMIMARGLANMVKSEAKETVPLFNQITPLIDTSTALGLIADRAGRRMPVTSFEIGGLIGGAAYPPVIPATLSWIALKRAAVTGLLPAMTARGALTVSDIAKIANYPIARVLLWQALGKELGE